MGRYELLPDDALGHLASLIRAIDLAEAAHMPWGSKARIHILRNFTIEPIEPYLKFHLLRNDTQPAILFGGYETMSQEVLDPESSLNASHPDLIVLSLLVEFLDNTSGAAGWDADLALARLEEVLGALIHNTDALLVLNTIIPPIDSLLSGELRHHSSQIERLNSYVTKAAAQEPNRIALSDWNQLISEIGVEDALDSRFWKMSQAPFKRDFLNRYAVEIVRQTRVRRQVAKKCLILDCDNTLWGGVVGEDGLHGIHLHPEAGPGKAYYQLQESVLKLYERGILIALCSKNNEAEVWEVFDEHPHCLLTKSHLVTWRINWQNKADNIDSIAEELNIGVDSMVFVDDSPQECALIRERLPDVTTLQLPMNLAGNPDVLTKDGLFDIAANTSEDRKRTKMYQQEAQRRQKRRKSHDLTAYLKSLLTEVRIARASEKELARVAQLTQKTNQFNLTTRRYSEAEIRGFSSSDDTAIFTMSVKDRYGDMGLTGVLIAHRQDRTGIVDTLLLSCRILGRQLELAFIDQCLRRLENEWGLETWRASYIPTQKNSQVADFWDRVGFDVVDVSSGEKCYSASNFSRPKDYLKIIAVHME